ncbi:hypothetical protein IC575_014502 [Cucumis melo]
MRARIKLNLIVIKVDIFPISFFFHPPPLDKNTLKCDLLRDKCLLLPNELAKFINLAWVMPKDVQMLFKAHVKRKYVFL